jgi:xanthine dehydrogenase accessory factor
VDSVDIEVLRTAADWVDARRRVVLGTIVHTWGSAPRPVGALLAIRDDGQVVGSVSGGCVEDDLIERVKTGALAASAPEVMTYGVTLEQATRFGLPCGGTLQIVLEPLAGSGGLREVLARMARHEIVVRRLTLATGEATLVSGTREDVLQFDGQVLRTVHGPRYRLLIIGAGQVAHYLAQMAQALDYAVTVCEPREEYSLGWHVSGVELVGGMPDDVVQAMDLDGHCAVVALTHDPKLDDLALLEALKSPAFYVGALGSQLNNERRRARLAEFDLAAEEIDRLHGPVGLAIGSKTPPEIAVSILAQMTAVKRGAGTAREAEEAGQTSQGCLLPSQQP